MIDLEPTYLQEIRRILLEHVPDYEVRLFGSRIIGQARKYSDLDLALVGKEKIDWRKLEALKDAFAESDLPIMIDVLDWNAISDEFRKVIERKYEVIQTPASLEMLGRGA